MPDPVVVPVPFISQQPGLCGAACAQMLQNARGIGGDSIEEQKAIFKDIQSHTVQIEENPDGDQFSVCGFFEGQICELYGEDVQCWCTHPRALAETLNARLDGAAYEAFAGTEDEVTATAIDNINRGIPAVMLVYGMRHWLVINGYTPVESGGMVFGNHRVSEIHILNPEWEGADDTRFAVVAEDWTAFYMATVPFGEYLGRCVVVADEGE